MEPTAKTLGEGKEAQSGGSNEAAVDVRKKSLPATNLLLPWDRFSYWVHSILVVTFDIEMGQSIEAVYPTGSHAAKLSAADKTNICYMAFPDSNSGVLGDTQYHFRFKQDHSSAVSVSGLTNFNTVSANLNNLALTSLAPKWPSSNAASASSSSVSLASNYDEFNKRTLPGFEVDRNYMFGYVFFRQVKDKSLKRGYFQKVSLFKPLHLYKINFGKQHKISHN